MGTARNDNIRRVAEAQSALDAFIKMQMPGTDLFPDEETVTDLLTDLRHWCRFEEIDFDRASEMSRTHFNTELDEEMDEDAEDHGEETGREPGVFWTIDSDHINDGPAGRIRSRAGMSFVNDHPCREALIDPSKLLYRYRIFDADGVLYYAGRCSDDSSFAPLDWARADAGATEIQYLDPKNPKTGRWAGL